MHCLGYRPIHIYCTVSVHRYLLYHYLFVLLVGCPWNWFNFLVSIVASIWKV
ncbi:hypothetical protein BDW42DRAFT_180541, partial [Aspergillus taichungensis]